MATYQATRGAVEYRELDPVALKGKAEPVRIFHAVSTKARTGVDLTRPQAATYVGRSDELAELTRLFETTGGETPVRLVTVIGEAGMGKSRMVAELRAHVDKRGAGDVAAGSLPPVRRRDHLLGPRRSGEGAGRILESDSPPTRKPSWTASFQRALTGPGCANGCCPSSAWSRPLPIVTSRLAPGACSWRAWLPTIRRSSSSRTCTGPIDNARLPGARGEGGAHGPYSCWRRHARTS